MGRPDGSNGIPDTGADHPFPNEPVVDKFSPNYITGYGAGYNKGYIDAVADFKKDLGKLAESYQGVK